MYEWPQFGMSNERYGELYNNIGVNLTPEEIAAGWFFSDAFDGLLIHESWPEAEFD